MWPVTEPPESILPSECGSAANLGESRKRAEQARPRPAKAGKGQAENWWVGKKKAHRRCDADKRGLPGSPRSRFDAGRPERSLAELRGEAKSRPFARPS